MTGLLAFLAPYNLLIIAGLAVSIIGGTYTIAQHRQFKYDEAAQNVKNLAIERAANKALHEANAKAAATNSRFDKYRQDAEVKNHENQIAIDTTRTQLAAVKRLRDPYRKPADCGGLPQTTATA